MAAEKDKTCADRIAAQSKGRISDLAEKLEAYEHEEYQGGDDKPQDYEPMEALDTFALSVERLEVYKITIGVGGPQDWWEVGYDRENDDVTRIEYHFSDWFDHASMKLVDADWSTVERFARYVTGDFYVEGS